MIFHLFNDASGASGATNCPVGAFPLAVAYDGSAINSSTAILPSTANITITVLEGTSTNPGVANSIPGYSTMM